MTRRFTEVAGLSHVYDFQDTRTQESYSLYQNDNVELILSVHGLKRLLANDQYASMVLSDVVLMQEMRDSPQHAGFDPVDVDAQNVGSFFLDTQANDSAGLRQSDHVTRMLGDFLKHSPREGSPYLGFVTQHHLRESGLIVIDSVDEAGLQEIALSAQATPLSRHERRQMTRALQPAERKWMHSA